MNVLKENESRIIFMDAISRFGEAVQMFVAAEEMGELTQAMSKIIRGNTSAAAREHLLEEIVDVEIMLEQLKIIFNYDEKEVEWMRRRKINRLKNKLK